MSCRGYFLANVSRKIWKHCVSGAGMIRIDAGAVLWADGAIQIDVFANELTGDLRPRPIGSPARSRAVHPAKARFVGEHDAQAATTSGGSPPGLPHSIWKAAFLKAS